MKANKVEKVITTLKDGIGPDREECFYCHGLVRFRNSNPVYPTLFLIFTGILPRISLEVISNSRTIQKNKWQINRFD